jgi:hypothetical protein
VVRCSGVLREDGSTNPRTDQQEVLLMRMKLFAVLVGISIAGISIAGSLAHVALAGTDNNSGHSGPKRAYQFHGTVSGVVDDGDPATGSQLVVTVTKANGNGKRYLRDNPGDVTFDVSESTRFYGTASSAADMAVGDAVKVKARRTETGFDAKSVKRKS